MTLKQTVSKILGYEVTSQRAQLFANEEFGVLVAYIRDKTVREILEFREKQKETEEYKSIQKTAYKNKR